LESVFVWHAFCYAQSKRVTRGGEDRKMDTRPTRKMDLIDDDDAFCSIMASFASSRGLRLDYYTSLQDMGSVGRLSEYALAIVDFDLGSINGVEIAEYLPI